MIRFGLCCVFKEQAIKFRKTTAKYLSQLPISEQKERLARLCASNAQSLLQALEFCRQNRIGAFRINSQILPLKTHPKLGYDIGDLPGAPEIIKAFKACGEFSRQYNIRTSFHPDQFIILSSPNPDVIRRSVLDLEYQAQVAEWVNADVINIHAGGVYGDKPSAVSRLLKNIDLLTDPIRKRLTLENDDRSYSPFDLFPICDALNIPLTYDVHHHRCLPDGISVETATERCLKTWDREPLFHLSSPKDGWASLNPRKHHDFIDVQDVPKSWLSLDINITVEVEAKAKEVAVSRLIKELGHQISGDEQA